MRWNTAKAIFFVNARDQGRRECGRYNLLLAPPVLSCACPNDSPFIFYLQRGRIVFLRA